MIVVDYFLENPLKLILLLTLPLCLFGWRWRVYPRRLLVGIFVFLGLLWSVVIFNLSLLLPLAIVDMTVLLLLVTDIITLPRHKNFSIERKISRIASIRVPHLVELTITNYSSRSLKVIVRDDSPEGLQQEPEEMTITVGPKSRDTVTYHILAQRRGAFELQQVYLRTSSILKFWQRILIFQQESKLNVYPDMRQLSEYEMLARTNRLSLIGMRQVRRIGQDNEFERLRDYTLDDNYKHIDWRSTARRNKLIVKDFQANQSQRIIFLLDCGRMMANDSGGMSLLDHSLNAMLMLSYIALRRGDSVGMIAFSDEIHHYIPASSGMRHLNTLLHGSYDRFPKMVESRYDQAFLYLNSHCRKRSLVVLISNVIDEVNSRQIEQYMANLVGRHLPLGILLRDHRLFDLADHPRPRGIEVYQTAAAAEILLWRHQVLTDLESRGVLSLDVFPEEMTASLVNRYLEIKARHLL